MDTPASAGCVPRLVGLSVGVLAYIGAVTVSTWIPKVPITEAIVFVTMFVGAVVVSYGLSQGLVSIIKSIMELKTLFLAHKYPRAKMNVKSEIMPNLSDHEPSINHSTKV